MLRTVIPPAMARPLAATRNGRADDDAVELAWVTFMNVRRVAIIETSTLWFLLFCRNTEDSNDLAVRG